MTRLPGLRARLLEADPDSQTIRILRVVQDVLRDLMDERERATWAERAVRAVNRAVPEVTRPTPEDVSQFLPQLEVCARLVAQAEMTFLEAGRLLDKTGCFLQYWARYDESFRYLEQALRITEAAVGPDHPDTAMSLNNLAALIHEQGKYAEAEPLYRRALGIQESELGPDHPDTAASLNNLAGLRKTKGSTRGRSRCTSERAQHRVEARPGLSGHCGDPQQPGLLLEA